MLLPWKTGQEIVLNLPAQAVAHTKSISEDGFYAELETMTQVIFSTFSLIFIGVTEQWHNMPEN